MIHADKIAQSAKLARAIPITGNSMALVAENFGDWLPRQGNVTGHYYALLSDGLQREFVKVTGMDGNGLRILRGIDNTQARSWSAGSCVTVVWNASALREFMTTLDLPTPVVPAGTYCMSCNSCITVNSFGQIVAIDGVNEPC